MPASSLLCLQMQWSICREGRWLAGVGWDSEAGFSLLHEYRVQELLTGSEILESFQAELPWAKRASNLNGLLFINSFEYSCMLREGAVEFMQSWLCCSSSLERAGIHGPPVVIEGVNIGLLLIPRLSYEEAVLYCDSNHSSLASLTSFTGLRAIKNKIANVI